MKIAVPYLKFAVSMLIFISCDKVWIFGKYRFLVIGVEELNFIVCSFQSKFRMKKGKSIFGTQSGG